MGQADSAMSLRGNIVLFLSLKSLRGITFEVSHYPGGQPVARKSLLGCDVVFTFHPEARLAVLRGSSGVCVFVTMGSEHGDSEGT